MFPNGPAPQLEEGGVPEWLKAMIEYLQDPNKSIMGAPITPEGIRNKQNSQFAGNETTSLTLGPGRTDAQRAMSGRGTNRGPDIPIPGAPPFPSFEQGTIDKYGLSGYGGGYNNPTPTPSGGFLSGTPQPPTRNPNPELSQAFPQRGNVQSGGFLSPPRPQNPELGIPELSRLFNPPQQPPKRNLPQGF